MKKEEVKKKLSLKRLTIQNLDLKQVEFWVKDEQIVVKSGDGNTIPLGPGVTCHPKYC
jgi:hypothetical protein